MDDLVSVKILSSTKQIIEKNKENKSINQFIDEAVKFYTNNSKLDVIHSNYDVINGNLSSLKNKCQKNNEMILVLIGMVNEVLKKNISPEVRRDVENMTKSI